MCFDWLTYNVKLTIVYGNLKMIHSFAQCSKINIHHDQGECVSKILFLIVIKLPTSIYGNKIHNMKTNLSVPLEFYSDEIIIGLHNTGKTNVHTHVHASIVTVRV